MAEPAGWAQPPSRSPSGSRAQQMQAGPAPGLAFGGFWIRVLAFIVDGILLAVVEAIMIWALATTGQEIADVIGVVYFIGLWATTGQTVGMMPFGLHVVRNSDGGKVTWGSAILRFIGLIVAILALFIGVIWVAFDSRKRGLHDVLGRTVVVRKIG
jgi:uncharacterized RDD family membrane protein YckC